jgi:hypothetical protein
MSGQGPTKKRKRETPTVDKTRQYAKASFDDSDSDDAGTEFVGKGKKVVARKYPVRPPLLTDLKVINTVPTKGRVSVGFSTDMPWYHSKLKGKNDREKNDLMCITGVCFVFGDNPLKTYRFVVPTNVVPESEDTFTEFSDRLGVDAPTDKFVWLKRLVAILDKARVITLWNSDFFFGVLRKYFESESRLVPWRNKTFDAFSLIQTGTRVWPSLRDIREQNKITEWGPNDGKAAEAANKKEWNFLRVQLHRGATVANAIYLRAVENMGVSFTRTKKVKGVKTVVGVEFFEIKQDPMDDNI